MEQNLELCSKNEKELKKDCSCLWIIVAIVAMTLSFFVGVLVANQTGIVTTITLGGIIAIIVAISVLLVISIINIICCKKTDRKRCCFYF